MTSLKSPSEDEDIKKIVDEAMKAAERESWDGDKRYAFLFHTLARAYLAATKRLEEVERDLAEANAALVAFGREYFYRGEDTGSIRDAIAVARFRLARQQGEQR